MPTSDAEGKPWARDQIAMIGPDTVIDIGPGVGTYSLLARGYTDAEWVGIEAWAPYVTEYSLGDHYDRIVVGDVRFIDLHAVHERPDLVIIADVLEHLTEVDARTVLRRLQGWARHMLVSIPVLHLDQGAYEGNWFETHVDHWTADGMRSALGDGVSASFEGKVLAYFLWSAE